MSAWEQVVCTEIIRQLRHVAGPGPKMMKSRAKPGFRLDLPLSLPAQRINPRRGADDAKSGDTVCAAVVL